MRNPENRSPAAPAGTTSYPTSVVTTSTTLTPSRSPRRHPHERPGLMAPLDPAASRVRSMGWGCSGICGMGRPTAVEELLAERGVTVDHVTVYRWVVQTFTPEFVDAARASRYSVGDRWPRRGNPYQGPRPLDLPRFRAVDQYGQVIDVPGVRAPRRQCGAGVVQPRAERWPRAGRGHHRPGGLPAGARRTRARPRGRCAALSVRASQGRTERALRVANAQDLVQMQPRLRAPAEVAVQNRWAMASC